MSSWKLDSLRKHAVQHRPKKPYATPKLTVHGDIEKITLNIGTGAVDLLDGSQISG